MMTASSMGGRDTRGRGNTDWSRRRRLGEALMVALAGLMLNVPAGHADIFDPNREIASASAAELAQSADPVSFAIPPGPLANALDAFSNATGWDVGYASTLAEGKATPGISGTMSPEDALKRLLAGSGLSYRFSGTDSVTLSGPGADGTMTLSPITVEGQGLRDPGQTEGTNSYAGSQVSVGSKTPTSIREIPQSVSVVTRQRLDDRNMTTLQEALAETTGVTVNNYDETRADFYSRGYTMSILRDGAQAPHSVQFDAVQDLAMYDRIEVMRGPAGLFNGAGEPGGSINLVRKKPQDKPQFQVSARTGSWDLYRMDADVTGALVESKKIRGRVVGVFENRKSFLDIYEATKWLGSGTFDLDLTPNTVLSIGGSYHDNDTPNYQGLPAFYDDGSRVDLPRNTWLSTKWDKWNERSTEGFVELEHEFDNGIETKARGWTAYRLKKGYANTTFSAIAAATGNVNVLAGSYDWRQEDYSLDGYTSVPLNVLGQKQQFLIGADYTYTTFNRKQGFTSITLNAFNPNHDYPLPSIVFNNLSITDTEEMGAYGQARLKPGVDWLTFVLGGRATWWNSVVDDVDAGSITADTNVNGHFTPNAGLIVDVTNQVSVYGSYAGIFQPQTNQTPSGDIVDPREGLQYEIGTKAELLDGKLLAGC